MTISVLTDVVEDIHCKLSNVLHEFQNQLPNNHGLLIRPQLRNQITKSYKKKFSLRRFDLLPKSMVGRKKFNAKFR